MTDKQLKLQFRKLLKQKQVQFKTSQNNTYLGFFVVVAAYPYLKVYTPTIRHIVNINIFIEDVEMIEAYKKILYYHVKLTKKGFYIKNRLRTPKLKTDAN